MTSSVRFVHLNKVVDLHVSEVVHGFFGDDSF